MNWLKKHSVIISVMLLLISLIFPLKVIGYTVSLLSIAVLLFNPKSGLLFLIIYFPIRPFLIEINDGLKYLGDLIIVGLFIYVFITNIKNLKIFTSNSLFAIGFLGFCFIGAISGLMSGVTYAAIVFQLRAFLITFLIIFVIKGLKINRKDVLSLLWTTVIVAGILSIQGVSEKVSNRTLLLPEAWKNMWLDETNRIRIYGLIGNPNVLAIFLIFAFFISIYLKKFYPKFQLYLSALSILFFGVFLLTYSRGTLIAVFTGLLVYLFGTRNWKLLKSIVICAILSVPIIYYPVVGLTDYVHERIVAGASNVHVESGLINNGKASNKANGDFSKRMSESFDANTVEQSLNLGRLYVVKKGIEIFKEHPIIGTGFGSYGDSASLVYPSPLTERYKLLSHMYSDNQYIQVIVQTGIIGVMFFALFILEIIYILWKRKKINLLSLPLLAIFIGGVIAGLFYNIWEDKTFTLYFYLILGFVLNEDIAEGNKEF